MECNTDFKKGHMKEKCVFSAAWVLPYWNKSIPKTAKTEQMLLYYMKRYFSILMYTYNIYTVLGVSLVVLDRNSEIVAVRFLLLFLMYKHSGTDVQNSMKYSSFPILPSLSHWAIWKGLWAGWAAITLRTRLTCRHLLLIL